MGARICDVDGEADEMEGLSRYIQKLAGCGGLVEGCVGVVIVVVSVS